MSDVSRRDLLAASAAMSAFVVAPAVAQAQAVTVSQRWDLSDLYPNPAAWAAERAAVQKALPGLARFKGKLGASAASLKGALQAASDLSKRVNRLNTYASLKADEDLQIGENQERRQLSIALGSQLGEATAWFNPELLTVGKTKIAAFVKADPGLGKFRFQLDNVLRRAPHTLGAQAEGILAAADNPLSGAEQTRSQLVASDIPWPEVKLADGKTVRLDSSGYTMAREAPDRADRKKVFDAFFGEFQAFKTSLGSTLSTQVQTAIFRAKARKYPNALQASLSGDNIPEGVYRTLVAETNKGLPVLHRYFRLRQKLLGLPDMHYYDIYPAATKIDRVFKLDETRALVLQAVKPLGQDYVDLLAKSTASKWADYYPRKGKESGAYMNPGAYDVHPYLLLNHGDNYEGLSTFAHEWGHAMHSLLANKAQPYETSNYPTFTAEIASTLNEQLLARFMQDGAKTKAEKLFYYDAILEQFRGTFFRQTMFAEFELAIHEAAERGEGLSGESLNVMYLALLKKYHGDAVQIDPVYASEWAYIPHFYYNFYVYQYATSIAASVYFDDQILKGGVAARDNYLKVLKAGGSDYPVDILKRAGLDMTTPAPYQALIAKFSRTLDAVEALLA
ncbi:oligoendopeptidase F [soil metagenome]